MALVNPNIALSTRLPEFQPRNALAEYAQLQQIQGGQQAQELNRLQMEEYSRAREEEQGIRNRLAGGGSLDDAETRNFLLGSKTGRDILQRQSDLSKSQTEELARRAKLMVDTEGMYRNMSGQISNKADAATFLQRMVNDPALKGSPIASIPLMQQIQRIPEDPQGLDNWVKQFALGTTKYISENKPVTTSQDTGAGGRLISRPGLGGAATVVPGSEFTKTPTIGEITARGQLALAQQKFAFEKANPGFELQQTEDGSFIGINKRTLQAIPVTMGGAAPTAPGAGMPGPRLPAPATQVIPGMTSVLDQPAAVAAVAPGSPVKGSPKNKDISVSEQQASYNIARVLNAADEIGKITKKDPKALAPGGMEAALKSTGLEGAANLARSTNRQIVNGAQRDALDALLYLATGAAYNKEQLQGAFEAYIPSYTDDTGTREAKQARMTSLIQDAKVRAGKAWTPKMDAAMTSLTGSTGPAAAANIPAPKGVDSSLWNVMTPEERKLWQPK
jgi:hypothetical protein